MKLAVLPSISRLNQKKNCILHCSGLPCHKGMDASDICDVRGILIEMENSVRSRTEIQRPSIHPKLVALEGCAQRAPLTPFPPVTYLLFGQLPLPFECGGATPLSLRDPILPLLFFGLSATDPSERKSATLGKTTLITIVITLSQWRLHLEL